MNEFDFLQFNSLNDKKLQLLLISYLKNLLKYTDDILFISDFFSELTFVFCYLLELYLFGIMTIFRMLQKRQNFLTFIFVVYKSLPFRKQPTSNFCYFCCLHIVISHV